MSFVRENLFEAKKTTLFGWSFNFAGLVTRVFAATRTGLMDTDLGKLRQQWLELLPDPFRQIFAGWILEARNVVQVVMIKAIIQRFEY